MNTMKFKALLEALDSLPSEIKNNIIDMASTHEPACGTPGCFAGLISIVAKDIPELEEIYKSSHEYNGDYSYHEWANALGTYLGCDWYANTEPHIETSLEGWANEYPMVWGKNPNRIFSSNTAFGKSRLDKMKHGDVIVYLHGVYKRWVEFNNKEAE
jgi:hypothetical protein